MNSGTNRQRASVRHSEDDPCSAPSLLQSLVNYFTDRIARAAMLRVNNSVHEAVRWTLVRLILAWIGTAVLAGGIVLLLASGVKGLEALRCPPWLACLSIGVITIMIGLVAMKGILCPRDVEL